MARLTVTGGIIKDDYPVATGKILGTAAVPLPWVYPHQVELVAPCRRTFFVNCVMVDPNDGTRMMRETRLFALDLPWHAVGPPLHGAYVACLVLGFDADPRGVGDVRPRKFPVHSLGLMHHCLGQVWSNDLSFWNTAFRMREPDGSSGYIKKSMERLAARPWPPLLGVNVRIDP